MSTVEEILDKKGIYYVPKGKDILVSCFNPEHDDSNPSLRIDRETGLYHCLSCGYKGNLLTQLRVPNAIRNEKIRSVLEVITELRSVKGCEYPIDMDTTILETYRGISIETLLKFKAFRSEKEFPDRLVIPIEDSSGLLLGMIGRYEQTDVSPKYLMKPKNISAPLFPNPKLCSLEQGVLCLVEGLFDVINLHNYGMENVAATLGTKQLTRDNIYDKLLPYTSSGITKIIIIFDPDKSGRESADKLKKLIDYNTDLVCKVYNLPGGKDPGSLNKEEVNMLKRIISDL
jgi:DNA primase